jgi:hypothetical protein
LTLWLRTFYEIHNALCAAKDCLESVFQNIVSRIRTLDVLHAWLFVAKSNPGQCEMHLFPEIAIQFRIRSNVRCMFSEQRYQQVLHESTCTCLRSKQAVVYFLKQMKARLQLQEVLLVLNGLLCHLNFETDMRVQKNI